MGVYWGRGSIGLEVSIESLGVLEACGGITHLTLNPKSKIVVSLNRGPHLDPK